MPQTIVALVEDLVFTSKLRAAAQGTDARLHTTTQPDELMQHLRSSTPDLIVIDLNFGRADALEIVTQVRAQANGRAVPIVGFLSHVQTERAQQALAAGCTVAWPRSVFVQQLPVLLQQGTAALASAPTSPSPSDSAATQ